MSTSTFDAFGSGKGNKTKQPKPTQTSAQWDPEAKRVFISFCKEEIIAGRETGIGIDPVTNTIDAPSEWWDRQIKVGANSSAPSQAEDYQDAHPDEGEGSDESNGPVDVPNFQTAMSQDKEIGRATSSGKRKSSGGLRRATKKKTGPEILSASINNLVSCCREVSDCCTPPSSDVPSISECICTVRNLPGIERGSELYFYAVQYMRNQDNWALFADMETPEEKLGLLRYLFDRFP
ncbi:Myb DNA-bind 3 domain-containing protein [Abeliophyllum distichum]|uniref:Myb DNA-bind 3 domain-containing protein n=1 Tax=Abeliophyllum distichum TaxID=126358 RepID=A0ABD1RWR6_9LAMI